MKKTEETMTQKGKVFTGIVVSTSTKNTVKVKVDRFIMHPVYKKSVKRSNVFAVHNEKIDVKAGDSVKIISTRPISKTKHFMLLEKITI